MMIIAPPQTVDCMKEKMKNITRFTGGQIEKEKYVIQVKLQEDSHKQVGPPAKKKNGGEKTRNRF